MRIVRRWGKKLRSGIKRLRHLGFDSARYWSERGRRFGYRAVVNLGYSEAELLAVTRRDKDETFPYLQSLLRGDEKLILDLGCGAGRFTHALAELIAGRAIGIDATPELVAITQPSEKVQFAVMTPGVIPLADAEVDVIWIFCVLECLRGSVLGNTVAEMYRVLKPGGLIFVVENTTDQVDKLHYSYRPIGTYCKLLKEFSPHHLRDFCDESERFRERFSIIVGRKPDV